MKIYFIERLRKQEDNDLPYAIPYEQGFTQKEDAEYIRDQLMETEVIEQNEEGPEEEGWSYGITYDYCVAKFDDNDNIVEIITLYSIKELEV